MFFQPVSWCAQSPNVFISEPACAVMCTQSCDISDPDLPAEQVVSVPDCPPSVFEGGMD